MPAKPNWAIIVHGGAKTYRPEEEDASREAVSQALQQGVEILQNGGAALNSVEISIKAMEDGGVLNAGKGSVKRPDGKMYHDASIMDGRTLSIGAIACLQGITNPIAVARILLNKPEILLVGNYATDFAKENGFDVNEEARPSYQPPLPSCDTVGCVALDQKGNYACGLSTGGLRTRIPGALGDVVMPGCGFYADNERGALCMSGTGEDIARVMLASEILHRSKTMAPEEAIEEGLDLLEKTKGEAGCILIDKQGKIAWSHNSDHFAIAYQTSETKPFVSLKNERGLLT